MKYTYKVVSLEGFLSQQKKLKTFTTSFDEAANGVANAVEILINFYAEDGWEYVMSEQFDAGFFKTAGAAIFDGLFANSTPHGPRPVFIFRKMLSIEELEEKKKEDEERINKIRDDSKNKGLTNTEMVETADAKCPNCEALLNAKDSACWKCKADFGPFSSWRPVKI